MHAAPAPVSGHDGEMAGVLALDVPLSELDELFPQTLGRPAPTTETGDETLDLVDGLAGVLSPVVVDAQLHFLRDSGIEAGLDEDPDTGLVRPSGPDGPFAPFAPIGYRAEDGTVSLAVLLGANSGDTGLAVGADGRPLDAEQADRAVASVRARLDLTGELRVLPVVDR